MRVLILDAPQVLLDERRRRGEDRRDEMWDGVPHLQPLLDNAHQDLATKFLLTVAPLVGSASLEGRYHPGLFRTDDDYRVPDQAYFRPGCASARGLQSADLVVEIRSSWDETYEKLDFYARVGVREVLILHPRPRRVELFRNVEGRILPVQPGAGVYSEVLGIALHVEDDELVVTWNDGSARI